MVRLDNDMLDNRLSQVPHDEPASVLLARIKAEQSDVAAKPRKNATGNRPLPVATYSASTNKES